MADAPPPSFRPQRPPRRSDEGGGSRSRSGGRRRAPSGRPTPVAASTAGFRPGGSRPTPPLPGAARREPRPGRVLRRSPGWHARRPRPTQGRPQARALTLALLLVAAAGLADRSAGLGQRQDPARRRAERRAGHARPGTTYLLAGSDARGGAEGIKQDGTMGQRSDTIMLLHVPTSGPTALISLPRDTYVDIPGHGPGKLNAAYAYGGPALLVADGGAAHRDARGPLRRDRARRRLARGQRGRRRHGCASTRRSTRSTSRSTTRTPSLTWDKPGLQDGQRHHRRGVRPDAQGGPRGRHRPRAAAARADLRGDSTRSRPLAAAASPASQVDADRRRPGGAHRRQAREHRRRWPAWRSRSAPRRARTACAAHRRSPTPTIGRARSARRCCSTPKTSPAFFAAVDRRDAEGRHRGRRRGLRPIDGRYAVTLRSAYRISI